MPVYISTQLYSAFEIFLGALNRVCNKNGTDKDKIVKRRQA